MNKVAEIPYKKIKRISPSQFFSMKNCAYKSLLAEAFEKKPLLAVSPNAYLGTVSHRVLEAIAKREIKDEAGFTSRFNQEVASMERELIEKGFDYFVPLQMNVRDFGKRQIQLRRHFRNSLTANPKPSGVKYLPEVWLESKDKEVGGKADLIIEYDEEVEIADFKTGAVTEDVFDDDGEAYQEVKGEFQEQLMLYAYLYLENFGKFPTYLSIVDLARQRFNIEFSEQQCKEVFQSAKKLLKETNESIETKVFKASPSETNCKYCLYRPACSYYLEYLPAENSFNDVRGKIKNVTQYNNGNVTVVVENGSEKISIVGFGKEQFEYFNNNKEKDINFFNLRKEATQFVYSATRTTKIYEQ